MINARVEEKIGEIPENKNKISMKPILNTLFTIFRSNPNKFNDSELAQYNQKIVAQRAVLESNARMFFRVR